MSGEEHEHSYPRLLADVGGTNARFAWLAGPGGAPADIAVYPTADHATLQAAIERYLQDHAKPAPRWGAIGIANPVVGDRVQMTNHHWSFSISALRDAIGMSRLLVLNDFTALALALPALPAAELRQVGGGAAVEGAPIALVGAGTGLGVSGLLRAPGGHGTIPVNGEGGHVTLAGADAREDAVIARLRARFGHVSAERALSGAGLVSLYAALCEVDGVTAREIAAADVTALGLDGSDPRCREAVAMFCAMLGSVAGNLALTLGARGGVYIGGGIVPRLGKFFDESSFRARFEAKGRFADFLRGIPTWVVQSPTSPALLGAARALDDPLMAG